jgi:hypothetical protein
MWFDGSARTFSLKLIRISASAASVVDLLLPHYSTLAAATMKGAEKPITNKMKTAQISKQAKTGN